MRRVMTILAEVLIYLHILQTVIAGIGFLSDSYDLFIINMVLRVLSTLYPPLASPAMASPISTAALIGAVAGQLVCGSLADTVGRRAIFILTIVLIVVGSIGSAAVPSGEGGDAMMKSAAALSAGLAVWRGVLGFGVGGEYPLSATVTSEGSDNGSSRGRNLGLVFSMQGVGNLLASVVMITLLSMPISLEAVWRSALALGAVPGLLTVYWRWKMEESEHFVRAVAVTDRELPGARLELVQQPQMLVDAHTVALKGPHPTTIQRQDSIELEDGMDGSVQTNEFTPLSPPISTAPGPAFSRSSTTTTTPASSPTSSSSRRTWASWRDALVSRLRTTLQQVYEFRLTLLGTAGSWLIFDIVFYANGLSSASVLHATGIGADSPSDAPDDIAARVALKQQAVGSAVLALMSLPGYALGVYFIDSMGRRKMQLMGFAAMALLFLVLAVALDTLVKHYEYWFVFLYGKDISVLECMRVFFPYM
jgi:MFS family permease